MRVLFDQGTPLGIRNVLKDHEVRTAHEMGWSTLLNGELLKVAEENDFDVLLSTDAGLPHQQTLAGRQLAVVILSKNRWKLIKAKLAEIAAAVISAKPGTFSIVEIQGS